MEQRRLCQPARQSASHSAIPAHPNLSSALSTRAGSHLAIAVVTPHCLLHCPLFPLLPFPFPAAVICQINGISAAISQLPRLKERQRGELRANSESAACIYYVVDSADSAQKWPKSKRQQRQRRRRGITVIYLLARIIDRFCGKSRREG